MRKTIKFSSVHCVLSQFIHGTVHFEFFWANLNKPRTPLFFSCNLILQLQNLVKFWNDRMYHIAYVDDEPDLLVLAKLFLEDSDEFFFRYL